MGKWQKRIMGDEIPKYEHEISGKEVQVVLWTGEAYHGKITSLSKKEIVILSQGAFWYNFKKNLHSFSFSQIRELIWDSTTKK